MNIGKEMKGFTTGTYLGVRLLIDKLCICSFVQGNAKSFSQVFVPEGKIWIYSFIKQVFTEHLLGISIILRAGL